MDTPEAAAVDGDSPADPGPDAERPQVADYARDWPGRAASLIATLRDQLGDRAERIEHIGSTAIPGMAAKDVLDLQVSVTSLEDAARDFDQPLGSLGFRRTPPHELMTADRLLVARAALAEEPDERTRAALGGLLRAS